MKRESKAGGSKVRNRGFTIIEMLIVISIMLVLLSIAIPMYNGYIIRAKESKLHQDLATLNKVIEEYSLDKGHAPQSLDDLVPAYIKFIPDDITGSNTWQAEQEESPDDSFDPNNMGIVGVHSGSDQISSDGVTKYSDWKH
jgi:general secretion pathway protein G